MPGAGNRRRAVPAPDLFRTSLHSSPAAYRPWGHPRIKLILSPLDVKCRQHRRGEHAEQWGRDGPGNASPKGTATELLDWRGCCIPGEMLPLDTGAVSASLP